MSWKYIDFQENIDRNVTILSHYSYIINWPACFSSSMWISFSSFSSSCFCWNRACGRKVIISYMFDLFLILRRKVIISYNVYVPPFSSFSEEKLWYLICFTSFFNFRFWIHLYCSTFPSFAILLIMPFSTSALLPFTTTHIHSYSLF